MMYIYAPAYICTYRHIYIYIYVCIHTYALRALVDHTEMSSSKIQSYTRQEEIEIYTGGVNAYISTRVHICIIHHYINTFIHAYIHASLNT